MARWLEEGSKENVWSRITEKNGQSLDDTIVYVQYRLDRLRPLTDDPGWVAPDDVDNLGSVKRVAQLVTAQRVNNKQTKYWIWVKVIDTPEEFILRGGYFTVA